MYAKNRDHCQKNALDGFHTIIRTYNQMNECTTKADGDRLWSELTRGITLFRRTLSKLESRAYENFSSRFVGPIGASDGSGAVTEESTDSEGDTTSPKKVAAMAAQTAEESAQAVWNIEPVEKPIAAEVVKMPVAPVPPPLVSLITPPKKDAEPEDEESDPEEDKFEMTVPSGPWNEEESKEEWTWVMRDVSARLPLPIRLRAGSSFQATVVYVVSPLEFYVVKASHQKRLQEVDSVLHSCCDNLRRQPLPDDICLVDNACLARIGTKLYRAKIRMAGKREIQVYLVDYGRAHFVPRADAFSLPRCIANMAPPLAHYCSVADADSRSLDHAAVKAFQEKLSGCAEIFLRALGDVRRTHGELVEILRVTQPRQNVNNVPINQNVARNLLPSDDEVSELLPTVKDTNLKSVWLADSASLSPSTLSPSDSVSVYRQSPRMEVPAPASPICSILSDPEPEFFSKMSGDNLPYPGIPHTVTFEREKKLTWWNVVKT